MPSFSSAVLSLVIVVAGYLSALCTTPPNGPPQAQQAFKGDRIGFLTGSFATTVRRVSITVLLYHAILVLLWPSSSSSTAETTRLEKICPHTAHLDGGFFTWSRLGVASLSIIFTGAAVRLSAFGRLGRNFTFELAPPDRLVTTGIYRFIQHPGYTGQALVVVGMSLLFMRWDAAPACWISEPVREALTGWGWGLTALLVVFGALATFTRVRDEEEMLKGKFGDVWVRWHRETKRFVPWVV